MRKKSATGSAGASTSHSRRDPGNTGGAAEPVTPEFVEVAERDPDPPADPPDAIDIAARVGELEAALADARAKAAEAEKQLLYAQAEFQNVRRRQREEFAELQKFMNREIVIKLLPTVDNLERALAAAEQTNNVEALMAGVSGTLKQLQAFLEREGVQPIEALGKEFDPNFHEAIGHVEASGLAPNSVAEEVQRGYVMRDRVIRPSIVKVAAGT